MTIDIGAAATDRGTVSPDATTYISKENPANADGSITLVAVYANNNITALKVAIFEKVGDNNFTARDVAVIGDVEAGYREHAVNLEVKAGDYIGAYWSNGNMERDNSGDGYWYFALDYTACVDTTLTFAADRTLSLYGTGEEVAVGGNRGFIVG